MKYIIFVIVTWMFICFAAMADARVSWLYKNGTVVIIPTQATDCRANNLKDKPVGQVYPNFYPADQDQCLDMLNVYLNRKDK